MSQTPIQWTDQTWNPIRGCSPVSPGCKNCYAERLAARNLQAMRSPTTGNPFAIMTDKGPKWTGKVELIESKLLEPLQWRKPRRVFVNSMSDLFHENLPDEEIDRIFAVMSLTPHITYQVLTKRADRMSKYFLREQEGPFGAYKMVVAAIVEQNRQLGIMGYYKAPAVWPLSNVWLGVSVENQTTANERIPELLRTPAALRFVSYEPALAEIDWLNLRPASGIYSLNALTGWIRWDSTGSIEIPKELRGLDWGIIGGESGPGARPFDLTWARITISDFQAAGVPLFVKQVGSHVIQDGERRIKRDKKGGDMHEWPHDIRVRQFPNVASHFAKGTA